MESSSILRSASGLCSLRLLVDSTQVIMQRTSQTNAIDAHRSRTLDGGYAAVFQPGLAPARPWHLVLSTRLPPTRSKHVTPIRRRACLTDGMPRNQNDGTIAYGPCPSCNTQNRVFFGDILGVEGDRYGYPYSCPGAVLSVDSKGSDVCHSNRYIP